MGKFRTAPTWIRKRRNLHRKNKTTSFFVTPEIGWYGNGKGKLYATRTGGEKWGARLGKSRVLSFEPSGSSMRNVGFLGNVGTDYFLPSRTPVLCI